MNIAIVFEVFFPIVNGVLTASLNLAQNLVKEGHRVIVIAPAWKESNERMLGGNIPVYYVPSIPTGSYPGLRMVLPWSRAVGTILRKNDIDTVHITGPWTLSYAAVRAARRQGIPVVHTFHTMLHDKRYIVYACKSRLLVPIIRAFVWEYYALFIRGAVINTGPSMMVCKHLKRHFPRADIRYISNGVAIRQFTQHASLQELRSKLPQHNEQSFVFVGRLGDEKSVDEIISAMAVVIRQAPQARLFIAGDGPGMKAYRMQIVGLGLQKHVLLLGRVEHGELLQSGLLQHSLAFVTASTTENQPMTVIEAICCSLPIIIPDEPGIRELLNGNGVSFRPHTLSSLSNAMLTMLQQPTAQYREASKAMVQQFDGGNVAKQFLAVYRDALAQRG